GASSLCATGTLGDIDSTDSGARTFAPLVSGRQRSSTVYGTSLSWLPRSLIVPLPKSHQRYHRGPGKYVAWYGRSGAGPSHSSQCMFEGTGISSLNRSTI